MTIAKGNTYRRRRDAKLTEEQLQVLYSAHLRGASIRELARAILRTTDYASEGSAVEGIRGGFARLGLEARAQAEASARANEARRTPGAPRSSDDRNAARRFHRRRRGGYRKCEGFKLTAPERGRPCTNWAMRGSEFCFHHDEETRGEVLAIVDAARALSPNGAIA